MKLGPCLRCGEPGEERHHPEGQRADGSYVDPDCWVPMCKRCHRVIHKDQQPRGLDDHALDLAGLELGELCCRRTATTFRRLLDGKESCLPIALVWLISACLWLYEKWDPDAEWAPIVTLAARMLQYLIARNLE